MKTEAMENWIWTTLQSRLNKKYTYHNTLHISSVVESLAIMMDHYNLSLRERQLLRTAALFHDLAFIESHLNHEVASARMAAEKLPRYGYSQDEISLVQGMILATRIPQSPATFLEELLCDADLFYLGGKDYFRIAGRLKTEWQNIGMYKGEKIWLQTQLDFLQSHRFHTTYALDYLNPGKEKVILELKDRLAACA